MVTSTISYPWVEKRLVIKRIKIVENICSNINLRIYIGNCTCGRMKGISSLVYLSITDLSSFTGSNLKSLRIRTRIKNSFKSQLCQVT